MPFIMLATFFTVSSSPSSRGLKSDMNEVLSSSCASVDMPESTMNTPSSPAAKRIAQLGTLIAGSLALNSASACGGTLASVPPFTGSIIIIGLPCLRATSQHLPDCTLSLSQSR